MIASQFLWTYTPAADFVALCRGHVCPDKAALAVLSNMASQSLAAMFKEYGKLHLIVCRICNRAKQGAQGNERDCLKKERRLACLEIG